MSKIEVDKVDPQSGTALEIGTSGDTVTVPSGVGLTLTDSTLLLPTTITSTTEVKTNKISPATGTAFAMGDSGDTFTIPSGATISNLGTATGFGGGVETADQWRLTTNFTGLAQPIASNLEQCDTAPNNSFPGSAMTESSGIFTFPSTGYWYVTFDYMNSSSDESAYVLSAIYATVNDSAYTKIAQAYMGLRSVWYQSSHCSAIIDVTDTANVKVAFYGPDQTANTAANNTTQGNTAENKTYMTFLKLTDT